MLADQLGDNAALHAVYPMLGAAGEEERATAHLTELRERSPHAAIRQACDDLVLALRAAATTMATPSVETLGEALRQARSAAERPSTSQRERVSLLALEQVLRSRLNALGGPGIPRIVHLIRTDSSAEDLPLLQFLCYRSVLAHCAGWRVMLHTPAVPQGPRWSTLLPHMDVRVAATPQWLGDRRLIAAAHQSDVWRLRQLIDHGGFYFDWDLLLLRSPEPLRAHVCVMALERKEDGYDEVLGVSAIGAEPASVFLQKWLDEMPAVFNPRKYVAHSVALAHRLADELPALVRVLDHRSFYDPGWTASAMKWLFDPAERMTEQALRERLSAATGMHLFCSHANFLHWSAGLTEHDIEAARCNLAMLLRPYL